ncbi:hypothetical protein D3C77_313060 [compost metagenome]
MQRIEGMEEFLLRGFFTCQKLNIINKQNIDIPVFVPETLRPVVSNGINEFIRELLRRDIYYLAARAMLQNIMSDRMHQVRLSQTYATV